MASFVLLVPCICRGIIYADIELTRYRVRRDEIKSGDDQIRSFFYVLFMLINEVYPVHAKVCQYIYMTYSDVNSSILKCDTMCKL